MSITPHAAPAKRSFLTPPPNMTSTTADTASTVKSTMDKSPVTKPSCSGAAVTSDVANLQQEEVTNYINQVRSISSAKSLGSVGRGWLKEHKICNAQAIAGRAAYSADCNQKL